MADSEYPLREGDICGRTPPTSSNATSGRFLIYIYNRKNISFEGWDFRPATKIFYELHARMRHAQRWWVNCCVLVVCLHLQLFYLLHKKTPYTANSFLKGYVHRSVEMKTISLAHWTSTNQMLLARKPIH